MRDLGVDSPWLQLAIRFERSEHMNIRGKSDPLDDLRNMGIRMRGQCNADRVARDRRAIGKADRAREERRTKARLPVLADGPAMLRVAKHCEQRRTDCARYGGCLDTFVRANRGDAHAMCPESCGYFAPEDLRRSPWRQSNLEGVGQVTL